jgi:hypothetical protein
MIPRGGIFTCISSPSLNISIIRERMLRDRQKISVPGMDKEKEPGRHPGLPIKNDLKSTYSRACKER